VKITLLTKKEKDILNKVIEISEEDQYTCFPLDQLNALEKEQNMVRKDYLKRSKWRTQTGSYHANFNRINKETKDNQNPDIINGDAYKKYALSENRIKRITEFVNIVSQYTSDFIRQYDRVIEKFPNAMFALINITDILIRANRFKEAEKYARKAYLLYPEDNDMVVVNYSVILFYKKKVDEAIEICEASRIGSMNDMLFNNLGFFYMRKGDHKKSLSFYNKSIMLNKNNASAHCNRGILRYFVLNDNDGINDIIHAIDLGDDEAEDIIKVIRWGETKDYS
jgi:tetratricopeptide (TPR) repeat protein